MRNYTFAAIGTVFSLILTACVENPQTTTGGTLDDNDTTHGYASTQEVGWLLKGEHAYAIKYTQSTSEAGVIRVPLPLDHASQVPIYFELKVDPMSVVDRIEYKTDGDQTGNWGAWVYLKKDGQADRINFYWDTVMLTWALPKTERPKIYAATDDPARWLTATTIVDSNNADIKTLAQQITANATTPLDKMQAIINWTHENLDTGSEPAPSENATDAIAYKYVACTGHANAAAALGRAVGIPTRTLANILVGMHQATHYINEFYLGADLGWRRVEPWPNPTPDLPEKYAFNLRLNLPDDEGPGAMGVGVVRYFARGVPLNSVEEPKAGTSRMSPIQAGRWTDYPYSNNYAYIMATLNDDPNRMAQLFSKARDAWKVDFNQFLQNTLDDTRLTQRRNALEAKTLNDVEAIITALGSPTSTGTDATTKDSGVDPTPSNNPAKVVFINFEGGTINAGSNGVDKWPSDAASNISFLFSGTVPAFDGDATIKQEVINKLKSLYFADFNIQFVSARPKTGPYDMVMVGGTNSSIKFVYDSGATYGYSYQDCGTDGKTFDQSDSDISLVFSDAVKANVPANEYSLWVAYVIAHELGHIFGLPHSSETEGCDLMSKGSCSSPAQKSFFNKDMALGSDNPNECGLSSMNSYQILMSVLGSASTNPTPTPATDAGITPTPTPAKDSGVTPITKKKFGEACSSNSECESNLCFNDSKTSSSYCTKTCTFTYGSCPSSYYCPFKVNSQSVCRVLFRRLK